MTGNEVRDWYVVPLQYKFRELEEQVEKLTAKVDELTKALENKSCCCSKEADREALVEAKKAKKKQHKAYQLKEFENPYEWDVKVEKKALLKEFPTMTDNEATIEAASAVARVYGVLRKDILATLEPAKAVSGEKTWGEDGKVFVMD